MPLSVISLMPHLILAVLAGVLLNLTPCVLPAIPIKIRTILRESGHSRRHRFLAALAFWGGTTTLFLALAGLTVFLQWNWGSLFQSPVTLMALVALLVAFAMMTWWDQPVPVPAFAANTHGHRYLEAYLSGLFSAFLAAPCAGPFLGGVMVFAVTQTPPLIFLIFSSLGLGLALPYVVLLARPNLLRRLPRSGPWSETLRQALAFVLLAAAVFFVQSLVSHRVGIGLWWAWGAAVICWALWQFRKNWASRGLGLVAMVTAAIIIRAMTLDATGASVTGIQWTAYSPAATGVADNPGRPMLVEFTADWCINCKVLEQTVYSSHSVAQLVKDHHVLPLKVDLTRPDPKAEELLSRYDGHALPFAVVTNVRGDVVARFTGLFTPPSLKAALQALGP